MAGPKLKGIFTPHMVPLDERGRIDEAELRRLVEFLIQRGVHGLYPNGSTGEFTRFSAEERKEIVRIAADQARGRVKIMAGAAEANVESTLEACAYYHSIGCDAVAIVTPYYYPLNPNTVREYFATVGRHTPIDMTLYNIPQFSNPITLDTIKRLAEHERIIGIKDSSRDLPAFMAMINEVRPLRPDFCFLIGCEEMLVPSLVIGGDGGTIATSGVVPELIVEMYNLTVAGDLGLAVPLQYSLLRLIKQLVFGVEFPEGVRAALELRGFRMGRSRMPQAPEMRLNVEQVKAELLGILSGLGCQLQAAEGELPAVCAGPAASEPGEEQVRAIVERVMAKLAGELKR